MIRAPRLQLKYDGKPLDEALADLSLKTGLPFILDPKSNKNSKQPITLDTGDVPYWEAVEKFLTVAGLVEVIEAPKPGQQNQVYNQWNGNIQFNMVRNGPVPAADKRIRLIETKSPLPAAVDSIVRIKVLPTDAPGSAVTKGSNEISFVLNVTPAPSLTWQGCLGVDVRKAIDERGLSLAQSHLRGTGAIATGDEEAFANLVFAPQGAMVMKQVIVNGGGQIWLGDDGAMQGQNPGNPRHVTVTLLGKEARSKTLKELHGMVTAQVLTPPQALLTIENIHKTTSKDKVENGDHRIQIAEKSTDKAGFVRLRFRLETPVSNDVGNQFGWGLNRGGIVGDFAFSEQPTIVFEDAGGKTIKNVSLNIVEQSFNGKTQSSEYVAVVHTRGNGAETVKMMLTGRKSVCLEVPFVLKNIPLP
jgi:hypothetical protein